MELQHDLDEFGDHDPDGCQRCLEDQFTVESICRCGECCRSLLIETTLLDAVREPRIAELGQPFRDFDDDQIDGYLLNSKETGHCVFLEEERNLCEIYDTRPFCCRVFDCDRDERAAELREKASPMPMSEHPPGV